MKKTNNLLIFNFIILIISIIYKRSDTKFILQFITICIAFIIFLKDFTKEFNWNKKTIFLESMFILFFILYNIIFTPITIYNEEETKYDFSIIQINNGHFNVIGTTKGGQLTINMFLFKLFKINNFQKVNNYNKIIEIIVFLISFFILKKILNEIIPERPILVSIFSFIYFLNNYISAKYYQLHTFYIVAQFFFFIQIFYFLNYQKNQNTKNLVQSLTFYSIASLTRPEFTLIGLIFLILNITKTIKIKDLKIKRKHLFISGITLIINLLIITFSFRKLIETNILNQIINNWIYTKKIIKEYIIKNIILLIFSIFSLKKKKNILIILFTGIYFLINFTSRRYDIRLLIFYLHFFIILLSVYGLKIILKNKKIKKITIILIELILIYSIYYSTNNISIPENNHQLFLEKSKNYQNLYNKIFNEKHNYTIYNNYKPLYFDLFTLNTKINSKELITLIYINKLDNKTIFPSRNIYYKNSDTKEICLELLELKKKDPEYFKTLKLKNTNITKNIKKLCEKLKNYKCVPKYPDNDILCVLKKIKS